MPMPIASEAPPFHPLFGKLGNRWEGTPTPLVQLPFEGMTSGPDPSWGSVYGCNCIISQSL